MTISQALSLAIDDSSNTAMAAFGWDSQTFLVAFDDKNMMNVQSEYDDTVTPPTDGVSIQAYYRWYICQNSVERRYEYFNLNSVLGDGKPQNPSCQKVEILRQFL